MASLGKEQFLALYLSAGVISSFASYLFKAVTKQAGLSLGAVSIFQQKKNLLVVQTGIFCSLEL